MSDLDVALLSHGEKYDLLVDVVGDETSLEFCTLSSYYLDGNDLDTAMRANGTNWNDIKPLTDEFKKRAEKRRAKKRADENMSESQTTLAASEETPDSINELTIAGEFGFKRLEGPFEVAKDGTIWGVVIPEGHHPTVSTLEDDVGEAAVLIADGVTVGGGVVDTVKRLEDHDEVHVLVDQYARGKSQ